MEPAEILVIGGGPAGLVAATLLAKGGRRVRLFEKASHPRFHIGESLLPVTQEIFESLGFAERIAAEVPLVIKNGASFVVGDDPATGRDFPFSQALGEGCESTFNCNRADLDACLAGIARDAGVEILEACRVEAIEKLDDEGVRLVADGQIHEGRWLLDASGQGTLVGRHLGLKQQMEDHRRIACYGHFKGVRRRDGELGGYITVVLCEEGWFWVIPLPDGITSVGLVMDKDAVRSTGLRPAEILDWGLARTPALAQRFEGAERICEPRVEADFSYRCAPYCAPGALLVGDAATFMDPVFSSGVSLALASAIEAADLSEKILSGSSSPTAARRRYRRFIERSSAPFFRIVNNYYDQGFRDLFLEGEGPLAMHRAAMAVLAGRVFPKPIFAVRWRMWLFQRCIELQHRFELAPRKSVFSLLA